jgi:hypothetical protein
MRSGRLWLLILAFPFAVCAKELFGVSSFGRLQVGGPSPIQPGDPTAYPHKTTPRAKFYVLVVARGLPTMCTFEDCGKEGALVESLGGWITGDAQNETIHLAGLDQDEVKQGRQSIIVVADSKRKIVGIHPNARMHELPLILEKHGFTLQENSPTTSRAR